MAWLDFSGVWVPGESVLSFAAGDIPDCDHRMRLPPRCSELFVFDGALRHRSLPFKCTRFSSVAFRHPGVFKVDSRMSKNLELDKFN